MPNKKYVLSLFSSAGIGELGLKASGFDILLSNELLKERCALYRENYQETENLCGDIWALKEEIVTNWKNKKVGSPFLIYATPPCQGMSFNSVGKRLQEIREGRQPKDDPRNQLIIPTIEIVKHLQPEWLLLENVQEMQNTIIPVNGKYKNIIEFIKEELGSSYIGGPEVVNCADYGIPQTRIRLITIFTKSKQGKKYYKQHGTFLPPRTHAERGDGGKQKWVSLREAIGNLPALSSEPGKNADTSIPWHIVPIMKPEKFWWISNTPENETAYNNQCVSCGYQGNPRHGMCFNNDGRHVARKDTPIYCEKCHALLPRPTMIDKVTGERRRIKGFDSAYRRMSWDMPSPTLTQLFQSEASDKKIHPDQHRTLSVYEGLIIQTIADYNYKFNINGTPISLNACCQVIGESVPPRLIELICRNITSIENCNE